MHTSLTAVTHVVNAASTGSSSSGKGSSIVPFLVLLALFGVAYMVFLRPARNRQRAAIEARRTAEVGDEVTTTAGMIATVVAVDDEYITLEIAPGVHCRYLPAAVLRVNGEDEEEDEDNDEHDHDAAPSPDLSTHEVIDAPEHGTTDTSGGSTTDTTDGTSSA